MGSWFAWILAVFLLVVIVVIIRFIMRHISKKQVQPEGEKPTPPEGIVPEEQVSVPVTGQVERVLPAPEERPDIETPLPGFKLGSGIIPVNVISAILILVTIWFPVHIIRVILSIPFLLFCPGYSVMAAFFPKKESLRAPKGLCLVWF